MKDGPATESADLADDFKARVAEMAADELRERIIRQYSHIAAYQTCLDGLGLQTPGVLESHRRPADIRIIVQSLASELNHYRAALDKQLSVTLGQMQTIRELRAQIKDVAAL